MWNYLRNLLNDSDLSPHGFCLLWQPEVIWTHVVSDAIIAASYFSIPAAIAYFVVKRTDIAFKPVAWAFVLFITACGTTHVMSIVTLWKAYYGPEALVKMVTALVSVVTASALWPLMPKALAWPSPRQLQSANDELRMRVAERDNALAALQNEIAVRVGIEKKLRHSQKMEAIGQLTGGVAHDFNNLMSIILGNLERATRLADDREKSLTAVRSAQDGARRAATLTKQLLVFSRREPLDAVRTNINTILKDATALTKNLLPLNVHLTLDLAENLPHVTVDANEAVNAVVNLVTNARDAIADGGEVSVSSRLVRAPGDGNPGTDYVEVCVRDDGRGMNQNVIDHAFEPFFTTKAVGEGSGLGLSQVYGFAKQSGGYAEIKSAPKAGTSVSIYIPVET